MSKTKIKLLIADDSKLTVVGLKTMLKSCETIELIDIAENGKIALDMAQRLQPDVILMDIGMPVMDGIEATKQIKNIQKGIKIIMLTSHDSEKEVLDAFSSGANSYCMKDIDLNLLVEVIKNTHNGASWLDPHIADIVLRNLNREQSKNSDLTEREIEVLRLISQGHSNNQISQKLFISNNTVKTHIKNIFAKLEVEDRTQAAMKAISENIL